MILVAAQVKYWVTLHLWVCHLKVQSTGYGISSSSSENSGLHCTFGCATLKYSLQAMVLVAAQVKTLGCTARLRVSLKTIKEFLELVTNAKYKTHKILTKVSVPKAHSDESSGRCTY